MTLWFENKLADLVQEGLDKGIANAVVVGKLEFIKFSLLMGVSANLLAEGKTRKAEGDSDG